MQLHKNDIVQMEKVKRLNIINSITGIKPANLVGTIDQKQQLNLAIISSLVHLGSNPALLGFVLRPNTDVRRHSYENILETGEYTVNQVHHSFVEQAHYTSAKFDKEVSEFDACKLTPLFKDEFKAPFVAESPLKIGMTYLESIPIKANNTVMVVGEVSWIDIVDEAVSEKGHIDLEALGGTGISGLNSYYRLQKVAQFPYARVQELPNFQQNEKVT